MIDRRAKRSLRAAAVLALGVSAAVLPGAAQAQFFGGWGGWDEGGTWDGLSPLQVRRAIAQRGFRVVAPLRRNGSVFVADVVDGRGQRERLIVAAADAQILQRFLVDDGRGPGPGRGGERGFASRDDGDGGLVPPADIPDAGRRFARPAEREVPSQRFGDLGTPGDQAEPDGGDAPLLRRNPPPIRTVKPRSRTVERTPEPVSPGREPGAVESTPLAPAAPRPAAPAAVATAPAPSPAAAAPAPAPAAAPAAKPAPAAVAVNRTDPAPAAPPSAAAPAAPAPRRMTDPLAIPGGDAADRPVRSVATGITGTPAPAPVTPAPAKPAAKPGDVPVAPLD